MSRTVIPEAVSLIERDEGLVLHAYLDIAGIWTIGYGHTGPDVHPGEVVTYEEAQALAEKDIGFFARGIEALVGGAPTTDHEFGAMVSLAYNIGIGNFRRSTVLRRHVAGDHAGAADAFLMWDEVHGQVVAGLQRRRGEERALYLEADAPEAPADRPFVAAVPPGAPPSGASATS